MASVGNKWHTRDPSPTESMVVLTVYFRLDTSVEPFEGVGPEEKAIG